MANNPPSSGYTVKTGGSKNPYLKTPVGFIAKAPSGGNLSSQVPVYNSPSLQYSAKIKETSSGDITAAPQG